MDSHVGLTVVVALFAGVLVQTIARTVRLPSIVLLFATGAALGPDALGWVRPGALGDGLLLVVELAVAVILFEGALNLQFARLRACSTVIQRLLSLGAVIALLGAALGVHLLLDWSWQRALLFGSLVMVTGPTVIRPLLAELRLRPQLAAVLEAEAVLIDPIGASIATAALALASAPETGSVLLAPLGFAQSLGWGTAAGLLGGGALAAGLRARRWLPEGLANVLVLSGVLLLFILADEISPSSGLFAVTVAGVAVANLHGHDLRALTDFKDQISVLLIGLLFVLLAADVRIAELQALGVAGLAVVGVLVVLVRPLSVWISSMGSELTTGERVLAAWMAPRGIVAAAVASAVAVELDQAGQPGGAELRAMVFLTITVTVVLAGVTALPLASLLRVRLPGRDQIAILGAHALGQLLASELRSAGRTVVLLDSNPDNIRSAEQAGLPVIAGNALEERTLEQAHLERAHAAVGLTSNEEVNGLFVLRAHQLFRVPRGYVALRRLRGGVIQEFVQHLDVDALFESGHDVGLWAGRVQRGEVSLERWRRTGRDDGGHAPLRDLPHAESCMFIGLRHGSQLAAMSVRHRIQTGDVALVLVHTTEADGAHALLATYGFAREEDA